MSRCRSSNGDGMNKDDKHQPRRRSASASQGHGIPSTDAWCVDRLQPLIDAACTLGVHPNAVTLSSAVAVAAMLLVHFRVDSGIARATIVPLMMAYKWFADLVDGPVARTCDKTSALGGALDTSMDVAFSAAAYAIIADLVRRGPSLARLLCEGLLLGSLPFAAAAVANGPRAWYSHGEFKNADSALNRALWITSENSSVVVLVVAALYVLSLYARLRARRF
jgi:phosphatidylglycerophosphate synthase